MRPKWEAVRGQSGRPCEAEVGGHARPKCEAESGRPCEAESGRPWEAVGGRAPLIGSDHMTNCGRPSRWEAV